MPPVTASLAPAHGTREDVWTLGVTQVPAGYISRFLRELNRQLRETFSNLKGSGGESEEENALNLAKVYWVMVVAARQDTVLNSADYRETLLSYLSNEDLLEKLQVRDEDFEDVERNIRQIRESAGIVERDASHSRTPTRFPNIPPLSNILYSPVRRNVVHTRFIED